MLFLFDPQGADRQQTHRQTQIDAMHHTIICLLYDRHYKTGYSGYIELKIFSSNYPSPVFQSICWVYSSQNFLQLFIKFSTAKRKHTSFLNIFWIERYMVYFKSKMIMCIHVIFDILSPSLTNLATQKISSAKISITWDTVFTWWVYNPWKKSHTEAMFHYSKTRFKLEIQIHESKTLQPNILILHYIATNLDLFAFLQNVTRLKRIFLFWRNLFRKKWKAHHYNLIHSQQKQYSPNVSMQTTFGERFTNFWIRIHYQNYMHNQHPHS